MASNDKIYPGGIDRYRSLRAMRESAESQENPDQKQVAVLSIAEELAGLVYVLDGIRYSTRKG